MARVGDEDRKRKEAYCQHNGWCLGRIKYWLSEVFDR
jgi:hypothetical protein